jgi:hypothetical protein
VLDGVNKLANKSLESNARLQKKPNDSTRLTGIQRSQASKHADRNTALSFTEYQSMKSIYQLTMLKQLLHSSNSKMPLGESLFTKSLLFVGRTMPPNPYLLQSIVVFTEDPYAADKCIQLGMYINSRRFPAERYAPQLQITQCFNCGDYGHRAAQCKRKEKCQVW